MEKRIWYALGLVIVVVVGIAGYWYYTTSVAPPTEVFKVALVHTAHFDTEYALWNYYAGEKLDALPDIEVDYSGDVSVADFERVAGEYADEGYNLIIGITADYMTVMATAAEAHPDTYFMTSSGWMFADNLCSYTTWAHEGFYLQGILAAMLTETDKIGYVGGFPYPLPMACENGYIAGAQSVNPNITIMTSMAGTWVDIAKGYEIGESMTDAGVDFIVISCDGVGLGVIQAAKDAGIYACGCFVDMIDLAPNNIVTSVIFDPYELFVTITDAIQEGTFEGKTYSGTMPEGCIYLSEFHQTLPQEVIDAIDTATQEIMDGTLEVPFVTDEELPHN